MNYLRNLKAKAKAQSLALPSLATILTDNGEFLTESEINSRLNIVKDSLFLPATSGKLTEFRENLTQVSQHLPLILIKWQRSTQFGSILFLLPWRNCIFADSMEDGIKICSLLLDILGDIIAISPVFLHSIVKNILLKIFQGEEKSEATEITLIESQIFHRCHSFLKELVETYPSASHTISGSYKNNFPHYMTTSVHCYVSYLTNIMASIDYITDTQTVLNLMVDKLIWLEMSSQRAAAAAATATEDSTTIDSTTNGITQTSNEKAAFNAELSLKCYNIFDAGFDLLLTKVYSILHPENLNPDPVKAEIVINTLLYTFVNQVINIEPLVNLPFLLIYWSSFSEELCELTLTRLWRETIKCSEKGSGSPRSVCVLASMMVETNYVTIDQVVNFLENAVNWSLDYADCVGDNVNVDLNYNPDQHKLFYSVTQSIFYLISCKISEFNQLQLKSLRLLNLQGLIGTKLNPLLYCLPTIVEQFVEISRDYQIALCSHVIDKNIRLGLDVSSFFNHSISYYFPFNSFTFQLAAPKFDSILCY